MPTDEELVLSGDPEDFGRFYDRYVDMLLGHFARRVRDPAAAAALTAETFAAALAERRRFRRAGVPAAEWLVGIAERELADYRRRGSAADAARRRVGIAPVPLGEEDADRIAALGRDAAWQLVDELARRRRETVRVHVVEER
jgi:DNA-directed RNA polymerase specialized sigma24 family protein